MASDLPMPVLDLSSNGFIVCLAPAGRSHVVDTGDGTRPRAPRSSEHLAWAATPGRKCPYCLTPDPEGSEEHILSSAAGNWFWVIPPNGVCSACNHGVLSTLDTELLRHPFVALLRTLMDVKGRKGQSPAVGASNMRIRRDEDGALHFETNHERHAHRQDDKVRASPMWDNFGPPQRRKTARSLLKVGLGALWLARGPEEAALPRYDHVRDAIAGDKSIPLQYGFENSDLPNHALQIMVIGHEQLPGIRVALGYFGIQLWAESAGYRDQADAGFLEKEIDVEFAPAVD